MKQLGWLALATLMACGGGNGSTGDDTNPGNPDAAVTADADPDGYQVLMARDWTLQPNQELYRCRRQKVEEDTYITSFRALSPTGTHHAVLTVANSDGGQLGDYNCNVGSLDFQMLYASGIGTTDMTFPEGVGIKVRKGQYINLNLHLYNATDDVLTGNSGVMIKTTTEDQITTLADMQFAGTMNLSIPSNNQPHEESGGCTVGSDFTLMAVWPHQHMLGTHHKFEITHNGVTTALWDDDYSFTEQANYIMNPAIEVKAGDKLKTTCTWVNNTGATQTWGDSSTEEMCFTGMYRYPAAGFLYGCVDGQQ